MGNDKAHALGYCSASSVRRVVHQPFAHADPVLGGEADSPIEFDRRCVGRPHLEVDLRAKYGEALRPYRYALSSRRDGYQFRLTSMLASHSARLSVVPGVLLSP